MTLIPIPNASTRAIAAPRPALAAVTSATLRADGSGEVAIVDFLIRNTINDEVSKEELS
jgi:hypothetical protein